MFLLIPQTNRVSEGMDTFLEGMQSYKVGQNTILCEK